MCLEHTPVSYLFSAAYPYKTNYLANTCFPTIKHPLIHRIHPYINKEWDKYPHSSKVTIYISLSNQVKMPKIDREYWDLCWEAIETDGFIKWDGIDHLLFLFKFDLLIEEVELMGFKTDKAISYLEANRIIAGALKMKRAWKQEAMALEQDCGRGCACNVRMCEKVTVENSEVGMAKYFAMRDN